MLFIQDYRDELSRYVSHNEALFRALDGKAILITGAGGLIGSYMADLTITANRALNTRIRIIAVDRNRALLDRRFPDEFGEITKLAADVNEDELPPLGADYVIHAASNTSPVDYAQKPVDTVKTNSIGTYRMLEYCIRAEAKRFLFCSSVEAYGRNNGDVDFFTEDYSGYVDCNTVRAGYPSGKRVSEAMCNAFAAEYPHFDFTIARIGRIYGPTVLENDAKAPTMFISNAVNGENIVLKSDGLQEFSFGYVADCAIAMFTILLEGERGQAYNIADDRVVRLREFAETAAQIGGSRVIFELPTAVEAAGYSKITKALLCTDKLKTLGWRVDTPLYDGIFNTVKYLKDLKGK